MVRLPHDVARAPACAAPDPRTGEVCTRCAGNVGKGAVAEVVVEERRFGVGHVLPHPADVVLKVLRFLLECLWEAERRVLGTKY